MEYPALVEEPGALEDLTQDGFHYLRETGVCVESEEGGNRISNSGRHGESRKFWLALASATRTETQIADNTTECIVAHHHRQGLRLNVSSTSVAENER